MENKELLLEIKQLNEKLDVISQHLKEQEKRARAMQELKEDLAIIGKDMFDAAIEELEDVAPYFDTRDFVYLFKLILRNVRPVTRLLQEVQSMDDLAQDLRPLGKEAFQQILETLDQLDRKGYFAFFSEVFKIVDTVVTSFTVDDVRALRENITTILITIKNMTQPEMLNAINNALDFFQKLDMDVTEDISFIKIIKEMNRPEIKRGMFFMLQFMKNISIPKHTENQISQTKTN